MSSTRTRTRALPFIITVLVALALGAAGGWSLHVVLQPSDDPLDKVGYTSVTATQGAVSSSIALNTTAEWFPKPIGTNHASGVVTSIDVSPGSEVTVGSTLYTVDLSPVTIAEGETPNFRDIGPGAKGADVTQLQKMLTKLKHYTGAADGTVGPGTSSAIRKWQKSLGMSVTGIVSQGSVVFVPTLPTRVTLDSGKIERGGRLAGGEKIVLGLPPAPRFRVAATDTQAQLMTASTEVRIDAPDGGHWSAIIGEQERDETSGVIHVTLDAADEGSPCGSDCALVPFSGQTLLPSQVVIVPRTEGVIVPSSALATGPSGDVSVIDEKGVSHPVTVLASARGMSALEGINAGFHVRVPAKAGGKTPENDVDG